jgi:hypothetical protein
MSGVNRIVPKPIELPVEQTKPRQIKKLETARTAKQDSPERVSPSLREGFAVKNGIDKTRFQLQNPVPLPPLKKDKDYDGALVGANGKAYPANTPLSQIPTVEPAGGRKSNETLIFVNGINTTFDGHKGNLQAIANSTGQPVIGVYNATEGMAKDLLQSAGDKYDIGNNPAVKTLADTVYNELKAGRSPHIMAHSQGGLITSRALQDVQNRLKLEDGMTSEQAKKLMNNVKVETFGSASSKYPDGPKYVHYVNNKDLVPGLFGLGKAPKVPFLARLAAYLNPTTSALMTAYDLFKFAAKPQIHAGENSQTYFFDKQGKNLFDGTHTFNDAYLAQRKPFDEAYRAK